MLQVFPAVRDVTVDALYTDVARVRHSDRPWIVLSMISSADGAVSIDGRSGALGGPADRSVFRHLRSIANGVLVGAQTVRSESYSPLPPHQTLAVISRTSNLGDTAPELLGAGNTVVHSGTMSDICSRLDGDIWILEGGPTVNAQMLESGCVDEVCLTIAPQFVAGGVGRMTNGGASIDSTWRLVHIAHEDNFVFLRYVRPEST